MLKSEKREKIKRNRSKMIVSGRGLFNLFRIIQEKAIKINEKNRTIHTK